MHCILGLSGGESWRYLLSKVSRRKGFPFDASVVFNYSTLALGQCNFSFCNFVTLVY